LFFDHEPQRVCQFIADEISKQYGGITLVSLLEDTYMHYHTAAGIPEGIPPMSGNQLRDSFCQFCLSAKSPLIIQDATKENQTKCLLPVQLGLTRYAGVPIYRSDGTVVGTLCILDGQSQTPLVEEDLQFLSLLAMRISAELDRQEQLDSLQTDLDDTNKELQATQQRLIESEKLAVTGALSASIAHDIRNILASMNLQIDMGSHEPIKALAYVQDSLKRFNVLAHRLMSYAKPQQAMLEHINLIEVLNKVTSLLSSQFNVSRVNLHVESPASPVFIMGDEGRLEHLFVNLLINALQSLKPGGEVFLNTKTVEGKVVVTIRDTGVGIPPDKLETIFEPFVSTKKDGFGLGLFSCKQIASDHHARLDCQSTPGEGTTFQVAFQQS
jgi:signal transduction histidine kinase